MDAESGGSIDSSQIMNYLVAEYRKSGKGNRHNMKTITLKPLVLCLAVVGLGQIASAQNDLNLPDVSQAAEVKQRIALTDIAIKYHRPLVNGRKIWGGLVPTERCGAPALTKTRRLNSAIQFRWRESRSLKEFMGCT